MYKFNWYMVSTVSGKEDRVVEALKNRIIAEEVSHSFDSTATENGAFKIFKKPVLTPKEAEKKLKGEEYKIKWANMYPGYIFIKMDMTDEAWFVIRNTQFVTGLIGSSGKGAKPTPVPEKEIRKSLIQEDKALEDYKTGKYLVEFKADEIVEVIDGPYQGEKGPILSIDHNKQTAIIELESFGKKVPVELEYKLLKSDK
ncbi:transcription termination/antitermination protein NusG [Mycoplasma crocodyli]|uniref:Transcription termination/antitermination protein NusG n=1 Tax=Mycoplasma crocodyli (strain ATCC 51981 / MP145) TaxID=512564 RepID=D5E4U0_MYCCM|nr:transcription termination/antitermination protein NusG [Mycoplasma crocodyli]ADE19441.1 transcription anti-termination factor NusG [Mycoplasma crocodyli MP145]